MAVTPQQLYIGDDWTILIPLVDGSGSPVNLTALGLTPGAEFFQATSTNPIDLTIANSGVTMVDAVNGKFTVSVGRLMTAGAIPLEPNISPQLAAASRTRIQVFVTDPANRRTTVGVIPIVPLAP